MVGWARNQGLNRLANAGLLTGIHNVSMRGYETARVTVAKNRAAVRALAEESLAVESLDADAIRAVMAASAAPAA